MNAVASETQRNRAQSFFPFAKAHYRDSTNGWPGMGPAGEALLRAGHRGA